MPVHDWSRVDPGLFRDFHNAWYIFIREELNGSLLPADYYAITEQTAGDILTDVLTLHSPIHQGDSNGGPQRPGKLSAVAIMPPKVRLQMELPRKLNVPHDKQLSIRHVTDDRVVAIIEIVSQGNKSSRAEIDRFVLKASETIRHGIHLLVIDLQPTTSRDPEGIHGAICDAMGDPSYTAPTDKPLTLVSYVGMPIGTAYVEPIAVGDSLPEMPLFLDEGVYVNIPLEQAYQNAFKNFPWQWKKVLEDAAPAISKDLGT